MNENQAMEQGYSFTGCYQRSKKELVKRYNEFKSQGYKAVIVSDHASGYEKTAGIRKGMVLGYSIYAEKRYFVDREIKELTNRLEAIPGRRENTLKKYQKELDEINNDELKIVKQLIELKEGK